MLKTEPLVDVGDGRFALPDREALNGADGTQQVHDERIGVMQPLARHI